MGLRMPINSDQRERHCMYGRFERLAFNLREMHRRGREGGPGMKEG